jgi:hypothetical protein
MHFPLPLPTLHAAGQPGLWPAARAHEITLRHAPFLAHSRSNQRYSWPARHRPGTEHSPRVIRLVPGLDELSCSTTGLTLGPSQLVQAVPARHSHLWQRMWDVLRLIQPDAPLESNMQRNMKCDVTCCTVTSASHLGILCLACGRSEDTRFTDKEGGPGYM